MTSDAEEKAFLTATKTVLEESAANLETAVVTRLRQARVRALEVKPRPFRWLLPASGFAAVSIALLAGALWLFQPARPLPLHGVEDLEILSSGENLELSDDLEFYHWLALQHPAG